jgi:hypothetical protein
MSEQKMKIVFAPGCFDDFEGTQEELNELLAEINRIVHTDELLDNTLLLGGLDDEDLPDDVVEWILDLDTEDADFPKNTRH